jgi:hypothetical protein
MCLKLFVALIAFGSTAAYAQSTSCTRDTVGGIHCSSFDGQGGSTVTNCSGGNCQSNSYGYRQPQQAQPSGINWGALAHAVPAPAAPPPYFPH